LLKLYFYKKLLGFNDKDDALSDLIRDGQLTREEALNRLESEQYLSPDLINEICMDHSIDYSRYIRNVEKVSFIDPSS